MNSARVASSGSSGFLFTVNIEIARHGILSRIGRLCRGVVAFSAIIGGQRNGSHALGLITEAGIANCEFVLGDVLDNRSRAYLLLDLVLEVAAEQNDLPEKLIGS